MKTFAQELENLEHQVQKVVKGTLDAAGEYGVEQARTTKLFKHGNAFEQAIQFTPHTSTEGQVESTADYSQYLEYGNDQNGSVIYPKAANVLHFFANGEEVFVKHVKAHGPLPFMDEAADKVEEHLPDIWLKEFDKHIK